MPSHMPRALPRPRLVLPRYSTQQIFEVISVFLAKHDFTYTRSMLSKELVARGLAHVDPVDDDENAAAANVKGVAPRDEITDVMLREHLAFCISQLNADDDGGGGRDSEGDPAADASELKEGAADQLERVAEEDIEEEETGYDRIRDDLRHHHEHSRAPTSPMQAEGGGRRS